MPFEDVEYSLLVEEGHTLSKLTLNASVNLQSLTMLVSQLWLVLMGDTSMKMSSYPNILSNQNIDDSHPTPDS